MDKSDIKSWHILYHLFFAQNVNNFGTQCNAYHENGLQTIAH